MPLKLKAFYDNFVDGKWDCVSIFLPFTLIIPQLYYRFKPIQNSSENIYSILLFRFAYLYRLKYKTHVVEGKDSFKVFLKMNK